MMYGYARVSSLDQNEARQIYALTQAGVARSNIFLDKKSGKDFNRPSWKRLRRRMHAGDLLIVQSLDRLGRNYNEILDEWRYIVKQRGADIRVLDMPLLDTTATTQGLVGRFVIDIVLQILSFVAENERRNIHERQRQGIAAAHARGIRFGAPAKPIPQQFASVRTLFCDKRISLRKAAVLCGVSRVTFKKWVGQ